MHKNHSTLSFKSNHNIDANFSKILNNMDRINKYDYSKMLEEFKSEEHLEKLRKEKVNL